MEEIGRQFGINDRATLARASDLALLITRTCGRMPPGDESAKPVVALELACQERGLLSCFDRMLAAQLTKRPLPVYMKLVDKLVNALYSPSSMAGGTGQFNLITISGITRHFNCPQLEPAIHQCISMLQEKIPWRCVIAASLIVISGHIGITVVPLKVAEYVHIPWKDVQASVKLVKGALSGDVLESLCKSIVTVSEPSSSSVEDGVKKTMVRRLKPRSVPYLLSGEASHGCFAYIGVNSAINFVNHHY
jgi:hypothetical protein